MRHAVLWALGVSFGLSVVPAGADPYGTVAPGIVPSPAPDIELAGLELRYGAPKPPSAPRASPPPFAAPAAPASPPAAVSPPTPAPDRSIDAAVDAGVRHQREAEGEPPADTAPAATGASVSPAARLALDAIARNAGIDAGQMTSVAESPHDQALFLVERMFDPRDGVAAVRARYGTAGALAVESYRRMREIYRTLDLNAAQRQSLVVALETALIVGGAVGQVGDPNYEMVDVDLGAGVDRARFEHAVAASGAVARCVRPTGRAGDRLYLLEIPRHGPAGGGAVCADDRREFGGAGVVVVPPSAGALARFNQFVTTAPLPIPAVGVGLAPSVATVPSTSPAAGAGPGLSVATAPSTSPATAAGLGLSVATAPSTSAVTGAGLGLSVTTAPLTSLAAGAGPGHAIGPGPSVSVSVPLAPSLSAGVSPLISTVTSAPLGSVVSRVLGR